LPLELLLALEVVLRVVVLVLVIGGVQLDV
jgi:hypothetical protein